MLGPQLEAPIETREPMIHAAISRFMLRRAAA